MNHLLPLMVAIPLGGAFILLILTKFRRGAGGVIAFLSSAATGTISLVLLRAEPSIYIMGGWRPPLGINFVFDGLSAFVLLITNMIAFAAIVFSIRYMELYTSKPKYYALFLLMLAGMNGVGLTGDLFNLFVFVEIASIASYALVGFGVEDEELEASFKYLILGSVASLFILLGITILYGLTGSLNMAHIFTLIGGEGRTPAVSFALALFIMGFGLKAALVPFHAWLPDAHPAAPAPISAMLSGVLVKVLGMYALARLIFGVFAADPLARTILVVIGGLSMVVGGLAAAGQDDLKRLLAYSTINQMGFVAVGLGVATPLALLGALFHFLNHAISKSLLFLCSGSVEYSTGTRLLSRLPGLRTRLPVTAAGASVGFLSISGIPPFGGFWSKLLIIIGCIQAGRFGIAGVAVAASFLSMVYFMRVQRTFLFAEERVGVSGTGEGAEQTIRETPFLMWLPVMVLALACLGVVVVLPVLSLHVLEPAREALLDSQGYIDLVLGR